MMLTTPIFCIATLAVVFTEISAQCSRDTVSNCVVYDGLHVKTFDGNVYSFNSPTCGYTILSVASVGLQVKVLKNPSTLEIIYAGHTFKITISVSGSITFTRDDVAFSIPQTLNGITVSKPGSMVIVKITQLDMKIRSDLTTVEVIQGNSDNTMAAMGLCGNNDGCSNNDLIMSNGQSTTNTITWINSWATASGCTATAFANACGSNSALLSQATTFCMNLFGNSNFAVCSAYYSLFMNICTSDYCGCTLTNRNDCMCEMLDAFVRTCDVKTNSVTSWRGSSLCPIQCSITQQSYSPCPPNHKQLSCGEDEVTNPSLYDCEEGCYCPSGMRLFNNECLLVSACPCLYDGNYYNPSTSIEQDCNTCTCTDGKWVCTNIHCVTHGHCHGDPHCVTFDGIRYDFMGKCSYYLVRGIGFDIICDHYVWSGIGFVKNFQSTAASYCAKMIIEVEGDTIELLQNKVVVVNGQQIPWIPFGTSGTWITQPSSEFINVRLRNGVIVSFDGRWKAGVTIPTTMTNRVTGLLGKYNKNPADDFTKPDGTLAPNANEFGHSWKVPGSCSNENTDPVEHPCDTYPTKRPAAEQACAVITGSLFTGCSDDPNGDYLDCVYDGCNCPDDDARCLCDHYALQGAKCAAKGINVDWRATLIQCGIGCPAGQTYQTCGNSCTRTSDDISTNPSCQPQCSDGCNCPPGQALNRNNQCVQISQCPCIFNGVLFLAGFTFVDISNTLKYVCENAVWTITTATPQDISENPSLDDFEQDCSSNDFETYSGCVRTNTLTCLNKHLEQPPQYSTCASGCECAEGFFMDTELGMCVRPEDCPCMYKGISYPDESVISNRDEVCTCVYGFWECEPETNHWEKCSVWGDVHVRTFDETVFSFEGYCEYVIFEHVLGTGVFRVTVETSACDTGSCVAAAYIHYRAQNGHVDHVIFHVDDDYLTSANLVNLIISDFEISTMVDVVGLGVRVIWNKSGWIHVHVSPSWLTSSSVGLCGVYDNNASNDLQISGQTINGVPDFVNYYKLDRTCLGSSTISVPEMLLPNDPCNYLLSDVFKTCRYLVSVDQYLNSCMKNAQKQLGIPPGQRKNHYCKVIASYAQECSDAGSPVDWRTSQICPLQCSGNKQYHRCDTPCPKETCENTDGFPTLCQDKVCAEACNTPECPAGQIYLDGTYSQCVLPENCPPV